MQAAKSLQSNDLVGAIKHLESAANSTERLQDNYLTGLSSIYLAQAKEVLSKEGAKPQDALQAAAPYLRTAVNAAMLSTDAANPSNSANWAQRGYIYRQLIGISDGFDTWALNMYQKALALEPNNPTLWNEVGQVYAKRNEIDKAKESFGKAIALRQQYIDPHYYLALIFDQQGEKESAIKELEAIYMLLPADDQQSRDNLVKAIEKLKEGKSLSGNGEAPVVDTAASGQPAFPTEGDVDAASSTPADGRATTTAPQGVAPKPTNQ
jgi:tetratricopeptide (TPR) repeat protein